MRCFIAIEFDEATRRSLARVQSFLRESGMRGNYTLLSNLHLTLKFLGEISPAITPGLESVLEKVAFKHKPFVLELGELGKFSKGRRPIIWCGFKTNSLLFNLQKSLVEELAAEFHEFSEYEKYTPHITLVREAALDGDPSHGIPCNNDSRALEGNPLDGLLKNAYKPNQKVMVKGLSLMESTRRDGRLVYLRKSFFALSDQ